MERGHVETLTGVVAERSGDRTVLVDARQFRKAITASKAKDVTVTIDDDAVSVAGASIPLGPDADEYPQLLQDVDSAACITVSGDDLARLITRTVFATDAESTRTRYALGALLVETDGKDYLRLVGTDGRRLATDYVGQHVDDITEGLWMAKHAKQALKAIRKADKCTLAVGRYITLMCYGKDGTCSAWQFRQMDGRFPKWREVVQERTPCCVVDANDLAAACTQAAALQTEECRGADFCAAADVFTVSMHNSEAGKYFGELDASSERYGTTLDITLDASFVLGFAKACKDAVLSVSARDKALDKRKDKQDCYSVRFECGNADYIVMPLTRD